MATFTVKFDTDNDAFAGDPTPEIARILRKMADHVESGAEIEFFQTIYDHNGNDIGRFALKPDWYTAGTD